MPAPKGKGVAWTDTIDKQLLLAVIQLTAPDNPKWADVAALMGEDFTAESVRQHFQKLKKSAGGAGGEPSGSDTTPTANGTTKTPTKRTPGKKATGETTGKSSAKRKATTEASSADADDDESPTKKLKEEQDEVLM